MPSGAHRLAPGIKPPARRHSLLGQVAEPAWRRQHEPTVPDASVGVLVSCIFASWNQLGGWRLQVEQLRHVPLVTAE
jgi:hypothetical protein